MGLTQELIYLNGLVESTVLIQELTYDLAFSPRLPHAYPMLPSILLHNHNRRCGGSCKIVRMFPMSRVSKPAKGEGEGLHRRHKVDIAVERTRCRWNSETYLVLTMRGNQGVSR